MERHTVTVGHFPDVRGRRRYPVKVEMQWDGVALSLVGEGRRSWGQIQDTLTDAGLMPAPGWDADKLRRLRALWERWHLNNLRAGCEHQRAAGWGDGLLCKPCPVCGYEYGTAWLTEAVPDAVIDELRAMFT